MKILDFGSANIDYVYALDHIVAVGETVSSHELRLFPGGKGLNQSIALARAGLSVQFAGAIGQDGELLLHTFQENRVDISHLAITEEKSGHAIIQVSATGENSIIVYPGANGCISKEQVDSVLSHYQKDDIILLQNEISNLSYIIDEAHKKEMCIIFNPSPISSIIHTLDFHKLSILILNEVEAKEITGFSDPNACLAYFQSKYPQLKVMLTLGKNGCIYADQEQTVYQPIFQATAVDTTAAGDTFTGYFISGIANRMPISETLKLAACASAITVSRHGAAPSIPYRHEVEKGLVTMKMNSSNSDEKIQSELQKYIAQNTKNASLTAFAMVMQYSSGHTGNLIKKATGLYFKEYLQKERIRRAAELLQSSQMTVDEIIESVGYENKSYFRNKFKEIYGMNPLQYRKNRR